MCRGRGSPRRASLQRGGGWGGARKATCAMAEWRAPHSLPHFPTPSVTATDRNPVAGLLLHAGTTAPLPAAAIGQQRLCCPAVGRSRSCPFLFLLAGAGGLFEEILQPLPREPGGRNRGGGHFHVEIPGHASHPCWADDKVRHKEEVERYKNVERHPEKSRRRQLIELADHKVAIDGQAGRGDAPRQDRHGKGVDHVAHDALGGCERQQRNERKRELDALQDVEALRQLVQRGGALADYGHRQSGQQRHAAGDKRPLPWLDVEVQEAAHHKLPCVCPCHGGGLAGRQQPKAPDDHNPQSKPVLKVLPGVPQADLIYCGIAVEAGREDSNNKDVDEEGDKQRHSALDGEEPYGLLHLVLPSRVDVAGMDQGGVQEEVVWHDEGTEERRGLVDVLLVQGWDEQAAGDLCRAGANFREHPSKRPEHDGDEERKQHLKLADPSTLNIQENEAVQGSDDYPGPQGDVPTAEDLESYGAANDLLHVAADDGYLRLYPQEVAREPVVLDPAVLRQVPAGGHPEAGCQHLEEETHCGGQQQQP
mmetsp:Transcript_8741/g.25183  ORF Transcript_8741/g.25183 Transcript_8741/m.25183 type:complete len:535 (-) Transcript_8741:545-2149(-)